MAVYFLAFLLFTGCTDEVVKPSPIAAEETGTKITFSRWSIGDNTIMNGIIQRYNSENNQGIVLQAIDIPIDEYAVTMNLLMASGEAPDIIALRPDLVKSYMFKNWLMDLSKNLTRYDLEKYPPWATQYCWNHPHRNGYMEFHPGLSHFGFCIISNFSKMQVLIQKNLQKH